MTVKRFKQVYIEITNVCNMACPFCPGTNRRPEYMDEKLFSVAAAQIKPLAEQVYLHVMGEPLLHPDFSRLISICAAQSLPVSITTNGSKFAAAEAQSLFNPAVRQINISLHSLQQFAKQEDRDRQLAQILKFTAEAMIKRPELYINYRLWNLNSSVESLDSADNAWICRKIEEAFGSKIPSCGHSSGRKSRMLRQRLYLHLDTRFEWPDINSGNTVKQHGFCHALGTHFAILSDGTVVPCCLDRDGITALGNCRKQPLLSIIDGKRAGAMRSGFAKGMLVENLCQKCVYCARFQSRLEKQGN